MTTARRHAPHSARPHTGVPTRLLVPGDTCWRMAQADRLAFIVDAADYFAAAKAAMRRARRTIYMIGWDFDLRIRLEPGRRKRDRMPDRLGRFLNRLVAQRPDLDIYVLKWDGAMLYSIGRQAVPFLALQWFSHDQVHFQLDSEHPAGACHHQKVVVVDDAIAFCGGIDMTDDRWDTRDHRERDPHRRRPSGRRYDPWHDMTTAVSGDAAAALGDLARQRWFRATGERLSPPPRRGDIWPPRLPVDLSGVDVAIARTAPAYHGRRQVNEIERLYLSAIRAARETIYLESQYFASRAICEALADRLREPDGPEIIVVNPAEAEGWLESETMDTARRLMIEHVRAADRHGRFGIFHPVNDAGTPIYVHAKVLAIDDRLLRVGSSNINNRSMGFDTECDLAVEAVAGTPGADATRQAVAGLRDDLLAEHLGVPAAAVAEARRVHGSTLRAVEVLRRDGGRSLRPIVTEPLNQAELALVESRLLDPERPWRPESRLKHLLKRSIQPFQVQTVVGGGILAAAVAVQLLRRPRPQRLR